MSGDLAALARFVSERLDEDEAGAKGPPGWKLEHWTAVKYADKESGRNYRVDAEPRCVVDAVAREDAEFIARHDPARALREVAAKRALLAEAQNMLDNDMSDNPGARWLADDILRHLAAVWSDHPDYRKEWAS